MSLLVMHALICSSIIALLPILSIIFLEYFCFFHLFDYKCTSPVGFLFDLYWAVKGLEMASTNTSNVCTDNDCSTNNMR